MHAEAQLVLKRVAHELKAGLLAALAPGVALAEHGPFGAHCLQNSRSIASYSFQPDGSFFSDAAQEVRNIAGIF